MLENIDFSLPLILGYAELHYHLKYLYPKYFIKQPEIIADCPIRFIHKDNNFLPILLIIKDSDRYPIQLKDVEINITHKSGEKRYNFLLNQKIKQNYYSNIFEIDLDKIELDQNLSIIVTISYSINGKDNIIKQDNYPGLEPTPFECYYSKDDLPYPESWYAGETHYHSVYTWDQVEFGADIYSTKRMAQSLGLDWFFVTDHSYDLDDTLDNYTKNDPTLPKWHLMKADCQRLDEPDFRVIHGEEISIGNHKNENVHLLAINRDEFICGSGDSAEFWFKNKPENLIKNLPREDSDNLYIAAHPAEQVPFMQKLTLRRGEWYKQDFADNNIRFLQILNSSKKSEIARAKRFWIDLLQKGHKYFILAGNDAHGNFNVMRQIGSPFRSLFASKKQIFGNLHTVFKHTSNDPVAGIKAGCLIVSNGPFIDFQLVADSVEHHIGTTVNCSSAILNYQTKTNQEFGEIENILLIKGWKDGEEVIDNPENGSEIILDNLQYIRMEIETTKGFIALTNPIFID